MPKFVRVLMQNLTGSNPPPKNSSIYHYHLEIFFPDFGPRKKGKSLGLPPPRKPRVPGCCAAPQPFPAPSTGQVRRKWGPGVHEPPSYGIIFIGKNDNKPWISMTLFPNIFITNQGIYGQEKSLYFVGQTGMCFFVF